MFYAKQDYHTHTKYSFDGSCELSALLAAAVAGGVDYLAVTEHFDVPEANGASAKADFYARAAAVCAELLPQAAFCPSVKAAFGIELGQPLWAKEMTVGLMKDFNFDVVLGSQHGINGLEDFYIADFAREDADALFTAYFDTVYDLVTWNEFDVLAHMTYPARYFFRDNGRMPDLAPYADRIDAILKTLIANGRAIEVNLSGLATKMNATMPDEAILGRYKELGGEMITLGSDDHDANAIRTLPEKGLELAYAAGFRHFTVYEKRVPRLIQFAD